MTTTDLKAQIEATATRASAAYQKATEAVQAFTEAWRTSARRGDAEARIKRALAKR